MEFIGGPPTLAVEVRRKGDYGATAGAGIAAKRADYFEAGTAVVWDVDTKAGIIRSYRADAPGVAVTFGPSEVPDAEPAVPGWRLARDG